MRRTLIVGTAASLGGLAAVAAAAAEASGYLLIPGVGRGSPGGIDEALDVTTGFLIQARDGPAP
jgi:hypothetical protein